PDDGAVLVRLGIDPRRIALIRGSGVDAERFAPLPEPLAQTVTVALVARMLRGKGVLDAVAAIRGLRADGLAVELVLAGTPDPDSCDSLTEQELSALAAEPGIEWLGRVEDVRSVWARAAIAVLPSTYGEGLPRALLEAAACGRPIVATDTPGCREVVRDGEHGLLAPPHAGPALAALIALIALAQGREPRRGAAAVAGWSFAAGIVLFSGSLFALAASEARWLGWVTPFGGAALILGWAALLVLGFRRR